MKTDYVGLDDNDVSITSYDISVIPNDFNVMTIDNLIEKGVIKMPGFQRNYVWDRKRASRFIESLIIGLPVPQIFLYQIERNQYSVIDGQQRLLSIYFFIFGAVKPTGLQPVGCKALSLVSNIFFNCVWIGFAYRANKVAIRP